MQDGSTTTGYTFRSTAIGACSGATSLVYGAGSRSRYGRYAAGSAPAFASGGSTVFIAGCYPE